MADQGMTRRQALARGARVGIALSAGAMAGLGRLSAAMARETEGGLVFATYQGGCNEQAIYGCEANYAPGKTCPPSYDCNSYADGCTGTTVHCRSTSGVSPDNVFACSGPYGCITTREFTCNATAGDAGLFYCGATGSQDIDFRCAAGRFDCGDRGLESGPRFTCYGTKGYDCGEGAHSHCT